MEDSNSQFLYDYRLKAMARAIMNRAIDAGIPKRFQRIGMKQFCSVLDDQYHGGTQECQQLTKKIYKSPEKFLYNRFVLLDGSPPISRRIAGYALLFRLLACDMTGKYYNFNNVIQHFSTFDKTDGMDRNAFASYIRNQEVLFLGEFNPLQMPEYSEASNYLDEIFEHRSNYGKPTIISFRRPIDAVNELSDVRTYGQYLCDFSAMEKTDDDEILRIKVKKA